MRCCGAAVLQCCGAETGGPRGRYLNPEELKRRDQRSRQRTAGLKRKISRRDRQIAAQRVKFGEKMTEADHSDACAMMEEVNELAQAEFKAAEKKAGGTPFAKALWDVSPPPSAPSRCPLSL